ncbi:MAG TPA: (Fe-S)-binding protein [Acidimicrobiales bacterium]|nr:(Fe-S)-binding protein [Acidimicrobiales bacterium]
MRIALFVTCVNDAVFPETGRAVVTILERLGHEVVFPSEQTCCGQMHLNSGYRREAAALARRFVGQFDRYDAVVAPSASCVATIVDSYEHLALDVGDAALAEAARSVAPRVHELSQLLVDVLGVTDVGASFPHRVTYHPTCHSLRALRVGDRPLELLRHVRGLTLVPLADSTSCCGFGGTFAVKNADTSVAMVADKIARISESGAEVCCAADNSCLAHIGGAGARLRSGFRVMHLAEILASTAGAPEGAR